MNNEMAPILDILEELKQECKSISKAQAELRTTLAEQPANSKSERTTTQEIVQIHLSKETQAKIKEHQLFVLEALSQSNKKLDPKFETLQQLIKEQQKSVEYKNYSLFASVQLTERKGTVGSLKGKIVVQAHPTGRKRVDHRSFCDEVAHATTFTGAEVEAVLRLAAEIAKKHVENGDIVDFGDIGTLTPSFQSKLVEKGKTEFNPKVHITKPVVHLTPSSILSFQKKKRLMAYKQSDIQCYKIRKVLINYSKSHVNENFVYLLFFVFERVGDK